MKIFLYLFLLSSCETTRHSVPVGILNDIQFPYQKLDCHEIEGDQLSKFKHSQFKNYALRIPIKDSVFVCRKDLSQNPFVSEIETVAFSIMSKVQGRVSVSSPLSVVVVDSDPELSMKFQKNIWNKLFLAGYQVLTDIPFMESSLMDCSTLRQEDVQLRAFRPHVLSTAFVVGICEKKQWIAI